MSYAQDREIHAGDGPARPNRHALMSGLILHFAVFAATILVLYLVNSSTRGADGEWWVRWPIQLWAIAWGFHLWGVALATARPEDLR